MSMMIGVHQPHYMPWLGYLNKMAKSDVFVVYDCVQFEKGSPMCRNRILGSDGQSKFITVGYEKHGLMEKEGRFVETKNWEEVHKLHLRLIQENYVSAPFFNEIYPEVVKALEGDFKYMVQLQMSTIMFMRKMFDIQTTMVLQSDMNLHERGDPSAKLVEVVKLLKGDVYLSGNGARKYNDIDLFESNGIKVVYQEFQYPQYGQTNSTEFVSNLSGLDILFNCGVQKSREIFWNNVHSTHEI